MVVGYGDNSGHILGVSILSPLPCNWLFRSFATKHPQQTCHLPSTSGQQPAANRGNPPTPGESKPDESWDVGFLTKSISVTLKGFHVKSYIYQVHIHITVYANINIRYLIYIYRCILQTVPAPNLKSWQKLDHADSPEEEWTNTVSKHRVLWHLTGLLVHAQERRQYSLALAFGRVRPFRCRIHNQETTYRLYGIQKATTVPLLAHLISSYFSHCWVNLWGWKAAGEDLDKHKRLSDFWTHARDPNKHEREDPWHS